MMDDAAATGFDEECRQETRLWERYWHLLCHRSELGEPHQFVRFDIFEQEVAAFHDGSGVVVFDNRCPHRGTRIFEGRHGRQRFVCPYHGWSFAKGRLFIPERESFASDPRDADLSRYQLQWLGDFLFVSRNPQTDLLTQLGETAEIVAAISTGIDGRTDFNGYDYGCNWKIAVENALDQYHVSMIHRESLNRLKLEPAVDRYFGINNISYAAIGDDSLVRKLKRLRKLFDISFQSEGYMAIHLFPFTFLTSTFGYSYSLQQFYPARDLRLAHFTSRFYPTRLAGGAAADALQAFFASSIEVNHQVFAEDNAVCSRIPRDSWSTALPRHLSKGEDKIVHFRQTMAAELAEGAAGG